MATNSRNSSGGSSKAGSRAPSGGGSRSASPKRGGGSVSLPALDREYLSERVGEASKATGESLSMGGLFEALERFGLSSDRVERLRGVIDDMDVRESVEKAQEYLSDQIENARDYAKENPGKVIGGAAGVLVGASLLAMAIRRAGGESSRASRARSAKSRAGSSKKSSGSSKKSTGSSSSKKSSKRR